MGQASSKPSSAERPTFEDALAQVESIIERIESGEAGLEESLREYERGVQLLTVCREQLAAARQKVVDLTAKLAQGTDGGSGGSGGAV